jgi:hypothetical protein
MAAENQGLLPFSSRVIAISILTSLLIFYYGRNTGFCQSSLLLGAQMGSHVNGRDRDTDL